MARPDQIELLIPNPEINWGKNIYAPNGDLVDQKPGLIRVLMGGVMYSLWESPHDSEYSLTTRPVDSTASKIFFGYPNSFFRAWALAHDDKPFEMDDSDRINQTIACIRRTVDTDLTLINSLKIDEIGLNYRTSLAHFLGQVPAEVIRRIAVLEDELKSLTGSHFSEIFLEIADEMDKLGLVEIQAESVGTRNSSRFFSVTPDWLRRVYRQQAA